MVLPVGAVCGAAADGEINLMIAKGCFLRVCQMMGGWWSLMVN